LRPGALATRRASVSRPVVAVRDAKDNPSSLCAQPCAEPGDACESLAAYYFAHFKHECAKARKRREGLRGRGALARMERELSEDEGPRFVLHESGCLVPVPVCSPGPARSARLFTCVCRDNCNTGQNPPEPAKTAYGSGTWLGRVERMTAAFREVRAREHEGKARAALVAAIVPAAVVLAHAADGSAPALLDAATLVAPGKVERVRGGRKVLVAAAEAAEDSFRWHAARAEGQRRRFETLSHCGEGAVGVRCGACGSAQAAVLGCDNRRLCVSCRDSSANDRRARFARARGRLLHEAAKGGLLRRARTGGRYTEKHLTLTVPDGWIVGEGAVGWRVKVLLAAWRGFSQRLMRWAKKRGRRITYFRGFEWTAGADGCGHPHLHVWMFSPFLPVELLRYFWAVALQEQGVLVFGCGDARLEGVDRAGRVRRDAWPVSSPVILDIREVTVRRASVRYEVIKGGRAIQLERERLRVESRGAGGGVDLVAYVEGWVVSERDTNGRTVPPAVVAELYEALEARRQVQASAGFLGLADVAASCSCCGVVGHWRVDVVRWWDLELAGKRALLGLDARAGPPVARVDVRDTWAQLPLAA